MEPNKLENQIQEKLNSREIHPSAQAWDRLDAMLTVAEEKQSKRSFFASYRFMGIAASFLIFPIFGVLIYLENYNSEASGEIPISKNQPTIVKTDIEIPTTEIINLNINDIVKKRQRPTTYNLQPTNQKSQPKRVSISNQNQSNPIVEVIPKKVETPQLFSNQDIVLNQKNEVAEVEILVKKEVATSKIKVNATSLLSQVDGELNQTYRETKLEKIARNLNSVKVALTNRNNQ